MAFLKSIWKNNSKHKKLSEELALKNAKEDDKKQAEPIESKKDDDVVTFKLKYLGSTVVEKVVGENVSPEAVKNIIKVAKASGKKLPRVNVAISLKGIHVTDNKGNEMFDVSVYRISNCSTDKAHRQVFSFISIDANESMECHAFWCSKRKIAEMVALTVAHAFSAAYEFWRVSPNLGELWKNGESLQSENMKNALNTIKNNLAEDDLMDMKTEDEQIIEEKLIDFDNDPITEVGINITYTINGPSGDMAKNQWVCFDDDFGSSFHDDFQAEFPTEFLCEFEKGLANSAQNQNSFLIDNQRWSNQNNIDMIFS